VAQQTPSAPKCDLPLADLGALVNLDVRAQLQARGLVMRRHLFEVLLKQGLVQDECRCAQVLFGEAVEVAARNACLDF